DGSGFDHVTFLNANVGDVDRSDTFRNFRQFEFDGHERNDFEKKGG
ncbi:MAG: hypothetical protein RLZZ232_3368, partial [Planctomycetota bacterium]